MSDVNQSCAAIIECVINSGLDFNINQTPYSIHLSLRKKFSKISSKTQPIPSKSSTLKSEHQEDQLRQELLLTRNEYVRLYNLYMMENSAKCKIEEEHNSVLEKVESDNRIIKNLKKENQQLKDKNEQKALEVKHLKSDLENMNKDINGLSVALKPARADLKEHSKQFDKKEIVLKKKVVELSEYRKGKLAEEREVKLKNRKELKKERQKRKHALEDSNEKNVEDRIKPEPKHSDTHASQNNGTIEETDVNRNPVEEVVANSNHSNAAESELVGRNLEGLGNSGEPKKIDEATEEYFEDENVEVMSDGDFFEHLWMKYCGQPRPAMFASQQEPKSNDDNRDLNG